MDIIPLAIGCVCIVWFLRLLVKNAEQPKPGDLQVEAKKMLAFYMKPTVFLLMTLIFVSLVASLNFKPVSQIPSLASTTPPLWDEYNRKFAETQSGAIFSLFMLAMGGIMHWRIQSYIKACFYAGVLSAAVRTIGIFLSNKYVQPISYLFLFAETFGYAILFNSLIGLFPTFRRRRKQAASNQAGAKATGDTLNVIGE